MTTKIKRSGGFPSNRDTRRMDIKMDKGATFIKSPHSQRKREP